MSTCLIAEFGVLMFWEVVACSSMVFLVSAQNIVIDFLIFSMSTSVIDEWLSVAVKQACLGLIFEVNRQLLLQRLRVEISFCS